MTPERSHWDGTHEGNDVNRGETKIIGTSHDSMGVRCNEGCANHVADKTATRKLRQQVKEHPMQNAACDADSRRGTFEDLIQICCVGMERSKFEKIINLFE